MNQVSVYGFRLRSGISVSERLGTGFVKLRALGSCLCENRAVLVLERKAIRSKHAKDISVNFNQFLRPWADCDIGPIFRLGFWINKGPVYKHWVLTNDFGSSYILPLGYNVMTNNKTKQK